MYMRHVHTFAPLRPQIFSKIASKLFYYENEF